jgi:hypothetical protein
VQLQAEQVPLPNEGQFLKVGGGAHGLVCLLPPLICPRSELLRLEIVDLFKLSLLIDFFMMFVFLFVRDVNELTGS